MIVGCKSLLTFHGNLLFSFMEVAITAAFVKGPGYVAILLLSSISGDFLTQSKHTEFQFVHFRLHGLHGSFNTIHQWQLSYFYSYRFSFICAGLYNIFLNGQRCLLIGPYQVCVLIKLSSVCTYKVISSNPNLDMHGGCMFSQCLHGLLPDTPVSTCWQVNCFLFKLALVCVCTNVQQGPQIVSPLKAGTDEKVQ